MISPNDSRVNKDIQKKSEEAKEKAIGHINNDTHEESVEYYTLLTPWHSKRLERKLRWVCKQCKLGCSIVDPAKEAKKKAAAEKKAEKKEGEEAESETKEENTEGEEQETAEAPKEITLQCSVWKVQTKKDAEKETVLEIEVTGEEHFNNLKVQLINNALEQLLADGNITQEALDKPQPKPQMKPQQQFYGMNMQGRQNMPMQQNMPPNMNGMMQQMMMQQQMIQQMMMQQNQMMQMNPQMVMPQMMMQPPMMMQPQGGFVNATGAVKRNNKRNNKSKNKNKNKKQKSEEPAAEQETVEETPAATTAEE